MSKVNELFGKELAVVNVGLKPFHQDLKDKQVRSVHLDWKPVAGGNEKLAGMLGALETLKEKIEAANKTVLERILSAQPTVVGMEPPARTSPA